MNKNTIVNNFGAQVLIVFFLICITVPALIFYDGFMQMLSWWQEREEYSHGFMIPLVCCFFIWQKRFDLPLNHLKPSWPGLLVVCFGLLIGLAGILGGVFAVQQYAYLITVYGVIYTIVGGKVFRSLAAPLFLLVFMIPLPEFLYQNLSQKLQLLSSAIGVSVIRACDISVYLEGNVIDLGAYKLQVVDACSGLRYLFPLMSFGYICAYLFKAPFWQRCVVFLTTIPITVLMNSFRIGVIGLLVNYWGIEQADGFLHDFEGWIIFMACVGILFLEMWLLTFFRKDKPRFSEVFGLEIPRADTAEKVQITMSQSKPLYVLLTVMIIASLVSFAINTQEAVIPERKEFVTFPDKIGDWSASRSSLDQIYIDGLKGMTDYILSDYRNEAGEHINLYSAYYNTQSSGSSIHSPASCLPGGGWKVHSLEEKLLDNVLINDQPLKVNRVVIQMGDAKQLVYYWFQQRGRVMTNEYVVKWNLLYDSISRNRTDGALVRLSSAVAPGQELADVDAQMQSYLQLMLEELSDYVPD